MRLIQESHAMTKYRAWETTVTTYRSKLGLNYSDLFTIASAMVIYVSTLPWIPVCFWKRKVVKRSTPLSCKPNSSQEQIRILLTKSNSPLGCTSGFAFNLCVLQKRPQVKEMRDYSGYRKCKFKAIKSVV